MNDNKLWLINKYGYPEDWVLVYTDTIEKAIEQYCIETSRELISIDDFYENYDCDDINSICGKRIKEIVFEEN